MILEPGANAEITDLAERRRAADELTRPLAESLQLPPPYTSSQLHIYPDIEPRTDEWYEARRGMVTASVVGRLITPTRLEVADNDTSRGWTALLAAERITGFVDPTFQSEDMMRGVDGEPLAVDAYSAHFAPVSLVGFMVRSWGPCRIGYSPDGLVGDDGLIEVKSPRSKGHLQTVLAGRVPDEHMAQCQAGLFVSGRDWLDYVSYSGGMALWRTRVVPGPHWFAAIAAAVETFERAAADMVAKYEAAVEGLPMTERPILEMVI